MIEQNDNIKLSQETHKTIEVNPLNQESVESLTTIIKTESDEVISATPVFIDKLKNSGYSEEQISSAQSEINFRERNNSIEQNVKNITENLEENNESKNEIKNIPEDFKKDAKSMINYLEKNRQNAQEGYIYTYGEFIESTSQGEKLQIETIRGSTNGTFSDENKDNLFLIAKKAQSGKVVGLRLTHLLTDHKHSQTEDGQIVYTYGARGQIVTSERGTGIASALDRAYEKTLSKIANEEQEHWNNLYKDTEFKPPKINVEWQIADDNKEKLIELQNTIKYEEDLEKKSDLINELKTKEEEHKRWEALYGTGGKFDFQMIQKRNDSLPDIYKKTIESNTKETHDGLPNVKISIEKYDTILEDLKESIK